MLSIQLKQLEETVTFYEILGEEIKAQRDQIETITQDLFSSFHGLQADVFSSEFCGLLTGVSSTYEQYPNNFNRLLEVQGEILASLQMALEVFCSQKSRCDGFLNALTDPSFSPMYESCVERSIGEERLVADYTNIEQLVLRIGELIDDGPCDEHSGSQIRTWNQAVDTFSGSLHHSEYHPRQYDDAMQTEIRKEYFYLSNFRDSLCMYYRNLQDAEGELIQRFSRQTQEFAKGMDRSIYEVTNDVTVNEQRIAYLSEKSPEVYTPEEQEEIGRLLTYACKRIELSKKQGVMANPMGEDVFFLLIKQKNGVFLRLMENYAMKLGQLESTDEIYKEQKKLLDYAMFVAKKEERSFSPILNSQFEEFFGKTPAMGINRRKRILLLNEVEAYWEQEGYFDGYWWQDKEKLAEAVEFLQMEAGLKGGIDIYKEAIAHTDKDPSKRIYAIQALFNAERSGTWTPEFLEQLENVMAKNDKDIHDMKLILKVEDFELGKKEYQNIRWKEMGDWLEKNGYIADGINQLSLAVILTASMKMPEAELNANRYPKEVLSDSELLTEEVAEDTLVETEQAVAILEEEATRTLNQLVYKSLFGEMSEAELIKYQEFLEKGSTAGLTEAELKGILNVDRQIAFKKIDYNKILENRIKSSVAYQTSYAQSSEKLEWDAIISKKGETRAEHINRHTVPNNSRETHGVFNGNPVDIVNEAWEQRYLVEPISDGMGGTIYNIPYHNVGCESGYVNTGAQMDYVTIVTMEDTSELITAFPSFGDYHK